MSPGTYYLGLYNIVSGGATTWDETTGISSTIPGRWQTSSSPPGSFHSTEDSVFTVIDTTTTIIPEPGTVFLFGAGLLGIASFIRKRRRSAA